MQTTPDPNPSAKPSGSRNDVLTIHSPGTGERVGEIAITPLSEIPAIFKRAKEAQITWGQYSLKKRAAKLRDIRETIINRVDELIALVSAENGKPKFEAISNDLLPVVDLLTYFAKIGPKVLKDRNLPLHQPLFPHRKSYLHHAPLGVVAVISPWNFPFLLPFGEIAMALMAGNAVVFKPSEVTPLIGAKIQELCDEAGLPTGLVQTVIGGGAHGAAIVEQNPDKIFFTGSVPTGKKIMAAAAQNLTPVCLELGGKDAMIVLPDANLDYASSAALWGGFANAGQICASTERLIIHESIFEPFLEKLKAKAAQLRQGPTGEDPTDIGPVTYEKQKDVYDRQIAEAKQKGARFVIGGEFSKDRRFLPPTVVTGENIESLEIYKEETFGPVIAATKFKSVSEAIQKANNSPYGLLASVITRNLSLGEEIAKKLDVGTITVNEAVYTAGLPATPWGGQKHSGFGRKHSEIGLLEFVHLRHVHKPRSVRFTFKSWWWYPYSPYQYQTFRKLFDLYRKSWFDKLKGVPMFLWNFLQFIKQERRL